MRIDHVEGDKAVKLWLLLGALWFAVFTTFGLLLSLALLTALVVERTVRTGHSPFSNMYEYSVVFV